MPMVNLKRSKKEMEAEKKKYQSMGPMDEDVYPYGLRLEFDEDLIKKIKYLKTAKGGEIVDIQGVAKITEVKITDTGKGRDPKHISIQLQKIDIGSNTKADEKAAFESK